ncbi:MAG: hypothetical protein J6C39_06620 [Clostridia bacterium]|nr:hypothetical protein [Clostridia bacterium]
MEKTKEKKRAFDENRELLRAYREGDEEAGERLAELNAPLVYSIAGRFVGRCPDMQDLIESGNIGLQIPIMHKNAVSNSVVIIVSTRNFMRTSTAQ